MSDLSGRTALVTGSTSGIGREVAIALANAGAAVAVHGRSAIHAADLAEILGRQGRHAGTFLADLSDAEAVTRLIDEVRDGLPNLDILVAVAGADVLTGEPAAWPFERKLRQLIEVDVVATIRLARALGAAIRDHGGGSIVTIGWDQAEVGMEGDSGELFSATKGAVMAFTRSLARSLAPKVRVNCVAPGFITTAMTDKLTEDQKSRILTSVPAGRMGEASEIAAAVLYLASPEAGYVTGAVLHVNGGMAMI